jgi:hypothetical protein
VYIINGALLPDENMGLRVIAAGSGALTYLELVFGTIDKISLWRSIFVGHSMLPQ